MGIQVQGNSAIIVEVDGTTFRALRVTSRPVEYGALGIYRISMLTGTMAAGIAAASEVFQARWTNATNLALIWGVTLDGFGSGTAFALGFGYVNLFVARNWTGDGSGGTAATLSGNNQKLRTSMGTTLMGAIRISSTGALGVGTKTLDAQAVAQVALSLNALANNEFTLPITIMYGELEAGGNPAPIVLAQNEGIVARAAVPGTGTWQIGITMSWAEVASY